MGGTDNAFHCPPRGSLWIPLVPAPDTEGNVHLSDAKQFQTGSEQQPNQLIATVDDRAGPPPSRDAPVSPAGRRAKVVRPTAVSDISPVNAGVGPLSERKR
jgi:hypothetical protein